MARYSNQYNKGLRRYLWHHQQAMLNSLQRMWYAPWSNLMIMLVIAIALALPVGLWMVIHNVQDLSRSWDKGIHISLYLKPSITEAEAQQLVDKLKVRSEITKVNIISPSEGLQTLQNQLDNDAILEGLSENPLPYLLEIQPAQNDLNAINTLLNSLKLLPQAELVQLDTAWVKRLYHILSLGKRAAYALALLFGSAVLFIVGNTLRLAIQHYRTEIAVTKMVGATPAYIRRPFIYSGILYGLGGGLLAGLLVDGLIFWFNRPIHALAQAYNSSFALNYLNFSTFLTLLGIGALLGASAAWVTVTQQIRNIEPQ